MVLTVSIIIIARGPIWKSCIRGWAQEIRIIGLSEYQRLLQTGHETKWIEIRLPLI